MDLQVAGFVPFSTVDYPEHLAAVIFCQGCAFNCHYCQNPELIPCHSRASWNPHDWHSIITFLQQRTNLLDAVVFSGGEPTMQPGLPQAIAEVKKLGFKIGLHTAGFYPEVLAQILPLLDWVGLDIKAPFSEYASITQVKNSGEKVLASAKLLLATTTTVRTTIHPNLLTEQQILQLAQDLKKLGVENYQLQKFRAQGCNNKELCTADLTGYPSQELQEKLSSLFANFKVV